VAAGCCAVWPLAASAYLQLLLEARRLVVRALQRLLHLWIDVALELSGLADVMHRSAWMYVILVGAAVIFDLRVLGFGCGIGVTPLARHLLP
jgi:hypothetical protein